MFYKLGMSTATDMLAKVEAAISAVLTSGETVTWDGVTVGRSDIERLHKVRAYWQREVRREQDLAAGRSGGYAVASFREVG